MSLTDYIIAVFYLVDDLLTEMKEGGWTLRRCGSQPKPADSVVLACEFIGEFLGHDMEDPLL